MCRTFAVQGIARLLGQSKAILQLDLRLIPFCHRSRPTGMPPEAVSKRIGRLSPLDTGDSMQGFPLMRSATSKSQPAAKQVWTRSAVLLISALVSSKQENRRPRLDGHWLI